MSSASHNANTGQSPEITDLNLEFDRLRAIEQRFEDFTNAASDFAFITLDLDDRVTSWNKGAEQLLGYSEPEILGCSCRLFFTPRDLSSGEADLELAAARTQGRAEHDRWYVRKDGSRVWVCGVITLLRDRQGNARGFTKIMRDHTAQRKNLDALTASEERFRLLVESVRDCALVSIDLEGNIVDWNPGAERIFGYRAAEVLGHSAPDLFTIDDQSKSSMFACAALEDGASGECWMPRKDSSRFYARWIANAIRDETGNLLGFTKVLRDETERKRIEEDRALATQQHRQWLEGRVHLTNMALHRTKEELQDLAGQLLNAQDEERRQIARDLHDHLAQRLALVSMKLAQICISLAGNQDAVLSHLEEIQTHISKLSTDVRDLSHRIHPSTLEHIGILPALRSLVDEHRSLSGSLIQLDASDFFDDGLPPGVRSALYRISEEALRNIQRHAGDVPVTLTLYRNPGEVHLHVQDNGPGFSPDALEHRNTLGLISMDERARLVGGTLELMSRPGEGTTLKVVIPVQNDGGEMVSA